MRSSRMVFGSIVCALALRASPVAAQRWPIVAEPRAPAAPPVASEPTSSASPIVSPSPSPSPSASPSASPSPSIDRWYGWQILIADAGALGFTALALGASAAHSSDAAALPPLAVAAGSFVFGGPVVHAVHGHWGKAGGSLALRVGLPLLGWLAGAGVGQGSCHYNYDHEGCWVGYAALGLLAGGVAAMIVDDALLGHERVTASPRSQASVAFTPSRDGGGLSVVGRF
jgi:hypothetical protein